MRTKLDYRFSDQDALDFFISNKRNEAFTPPVNSFDSAKALDRGALLQAHLLFR
eukprot:COSAG01_NODE_124_length_25180_cov_12.776112_16_plen_54_part_00